MTSVLQMTKHLEWIERPPSVAGVRLRTFGQAADVEAWLALRDRAFARERVGVRAWSGVDFRGEFQERWWWRPQWMWLVEAEERELIGSVTLAMRGEPEAAKPVVHWLMVAPRWRRRGVGRLLLSHLEQAAWEEGYREIWLETHAQWKAAVEFYEALGFKPVR
jgi:GNAT superfamily N-acetyltransferase